MVKSSTPNSKHLVAVRLLRQAHLRPNGSKAKHLTKLENWRILTSQRNFACHRSNYIAPVSCIAPNYISPRLTKCFQSIQLNPFCFMCFQCWPKMPSKQRWTITRSNSRIKPMQNRFIDDAVRFVVDKIKYIYYIIDDIWNVLHKVKIIIKELNM